MRAVVAERSPGRAELRDRAHVRFRPAFAVDDVDAERLQRPRFCAIAAFAESGALLLKLL